ncbi:hypothetical protein GCK72_015432 [Caenorhabditis remanei]|uniref:F-box domain-containing protein n=1 Tax=Caenorhabditis remanei TaxID=31234 RepID=A0A6A5GX84_CAERE|nr:hypothetical protein GCK72_015432 [Caenorhabditis remanei]KAF1758972.1 hypothetical protein GCK72_015432 [Caenorhabditis remanei]
MSPPKPFPILRLPFLAIEEVFKAMDPIEIINFSMISKRTKEIGKRMSFYPNYAIELYVHEMPEIRLHGTKDVVSSFYVMTSDKEMDGKIEEKEWGRYIIRKVFKYDPIDEWKQWFKYVMEIFRKQAIDVLTMTLTTFVDQNVSIIDFLKSNVKSVDRCSLYQRDEQINVDKHTAYLLDNVKINSELCYDAYINNDDFNPKIPKSLQELRIYNSKWIEYERLLEIDCKSVILKNNPISNKEWNVFVKKWRVMETNQNVEYLELDYREIKEFQELVLHDIPHEVVDRGVRRVLKTRRNKTKEISGGIDIRRIDGKTATFFVYHTSRIQFFAMSIH